MPLPGLDLGWGVALLLSWMVGGMHGIPDGNARAGWSYSGDVWTDADGRAIVVLPPFVRAHRAGFEYEVTPIDSSCSALVAEEIVDDRFTIEADAPHVKVTWRVTALREASR